MRLHEDMECPELLGHYLPRFYLKGFCPPDIPSGEKRYVWVYDLRKCRWEKNYPDVIAAVPDFYVVKDKNGNVLTDKVETRLFQRLESKAAEIIRGKVEGHRQLDEEERAWLSTFVVSLFVRVPAHREWVADTLSMVAKANMAELRKELLEDPEALEHFKEQSGIVELSNELLEGMDPHDLELEWSTGWLLGFSLQRFVELAQLINEMGWTFLVTGPGAYFVTSDHPFCMMNAKDKVQPGLLQKNVEITLPLTRTVCFYANWRSSGLDYRPLPRDGVAETNTRTWRARASEIVVGPQQDFPGHDGLPKPAQD